jgi:predicted GIY-YIG superfamily endonuclease
MAVPVCYLICWADQPIGGTSPRSKAGHYAGSTVDLSRRLIQHAEGTGARIMAAVSERQIPWMVARTWPGDRTSIRTTERAVKRAHQLSRFCPRCSPAPQEVTL